MEGGECAPAVLTEALDVSVGDEAGGEAGEGFVDVVAPFPVDAQAAAVAARAVNRQAPCPRCGSTSSRIHGRYHRRPADLAVAGRKVVMELLVRRFLCGTPGHGRRTFVGQAEGLTGRFRGVGLRQDRGARQQGEADQKGRVRPGGFDLLRWRILLAD
ncbi:transposase family protein [Streptomyces griseoloalbus]|uniref:transposase family protein n=1 Tax=Streptomyces griseoloalbus TaxID=67303 RepID=UPI0019B938ED|nr:hypothetical protein GCM10010340_49820 [Streptomyces albaduncus]